MHRTKRVLDERVVRKVLGNRHLPIKSKRSSKGGIRFSLQFESLFAKNVKLITFFVYYHNLFLSTSCLHVVKSQAYLVYYSMPRGIDCFRRLMLIVDRASDFRRYVVGFGSGVHRCTTSRESKPCLRRRGFMGHGAWGGMVVPSIQAKRKVYHSFTLPSYSHCN